MRKAAFISIVTLLFVAYASAFQDDKMDHKDKMDQKMDHSMGKKVTVSGWISDSECAAHGIRNCPKKEHVANGAKLVIVTDKRGVFTVTNPDAVADHQGEHVKVKGELDESAKTITVAAVSMLGK